MSQEFGDLLPYLEGHISFQYHLPSLKKELSRAASGITDIIEFDQISLEQLKAGKIVSGDKIYTAKSQLTLNDLEILAKQAYDNGYIAGYIDWLHEIQQKMEDENVPLISKSYLK